MSAPILSFQTAKRADRESVYRWPRAAAASRVEGIWLVCDSQKAVNTRAERSALQRRWQERRRTHRSRRQPAAVILLSCGVNRSGALYFAPT